MPAWNNGEGELIGQITALKRQDQRDEAQEMLVKVSQYVLPIMRKYKWRVGTLSEFYPKNANLLGINVNHGARVSLRLRYASNANSFLPFESVLGTMLHELCHNKFGPHNDSFFSLLAELKSEMEGMMMHGFRGDKFLGAGNRLGAPPAGRLSGVVLAAGGARRDAILRAKRGTKVLGRGTKLGGKALAQDPRTAAFTAAQRRLEADKHCGSFDVDAGDVSGDIYEISREEFEAALLKRSGPQPATVLNAPQPEQRPDLGPESEPEIIDLLDG